MSISIHNLAVLRAALEKQHLGTYFGSLGALAHWIDSTCSLGLIDQDGKGTDLGRALALHLDLFAKGMRRAYLWTDADALVTRAEAFMQSERARVENGSSLKALTVEQASHVAGVYPEVRKKMAEFLSEGVDVFISRQDETGPDVPPFAIRVCGDPAFWIDCCETAAAAGARARALGLHVVGVPTGQREPEFFC